MLTKWFFQHQFSTAALFQLTGSAANLQYAHIGCCNKNTILTFSALNTQFYQNGAWAQFRQQTSPYKPYTNISPNLIYWDTWDWPKDSLEIANCTEPVIKWTGTDAEWAKKHAFKPEIHTYNDSISYTQGYFSQKIINAVLITTDCNKKSHIAVTPLIQVRYNPALDTGAGNTVWLKSNLASSYNKPETDKTLIIKGLPIWMLLYGWLSYVHQVRKATQDFFISYTLCMESPAFIFSSTVGVKSTNSTHRHIIFKRPATLWPRFKTI